MSFFNQLIAYFRDNSNGTARISLPELSHLWVYNPVAKRNAKLQNKRKESTI